MGVSLDALQHVQGRCLNLYRAMRYMFIQGCKTLNGYSWLGWTCLAHLICMSFITGYRYFHLRLLYQIDYKIPQAIIQLIAGFGRYPNAIAFTLFTAILAIISLGIKPYCLKAKMTRSLGKLKIKAGDDCRPKIISVTEIDQHRKETDLLDSEGVGLSHYHNKKQDMEAVFNARVESIRMGLTPRQVEITLSFKAISKTCNYHELFSQLTGKTSFVVGESLNGVLSKSILDIPGGHLLIAGTTGGGKSNWFKATLLSLIETTPFAEFFLFDFKGGVEFGPFGKFSNVSIEKDREGALRRLRMIVDEMNHRFSHLEKAERTAIEPKKDKMNHLFVAVDEASLLYGKLERSHEQSNEVAEARTLTNDIAKRGRAAGISLILATQKITKETIDTSIQENITGRMCFRMNTLQGSMIVLGNKLAMDLSDIPGRAIWQCGSDQIEVQAPLLRNKDIAGALKSPRQTDHFPLLLSEESIKQRGDNPYLQNFEATKGDKACHEEKS